MYSPLSHGGHIVPGDQKALFYHAKPRRQNRGGEAWHGKTNLPGQSGRRVTRANGSVHVHCTIHVKEKMNKLHV